MTTTTIREDGAIRETGMAKGLILLGLALCAAAAPAQAQITFRSSATATATGVAPSFRAAASAAATGTTLTIARPAGVVANDVLIASIGVRPSTANLTPPSGWTLVRRINNPNATSNSLAVYRKVAGAAEPASYAWGVAGATNTVGGIQAFFNVDTANLIDAEGGQATASARTHATPGVTSAFANTMLVTSHTFASSATWTAPSGMIESFDRASGATGSAGQSIVGSRRVQSTSGSTAPQTATASNDADVGNTHILGLRPPSLAGLTINKPAGTAANDVMIASIAVRPSSASLTAPAGWTLIRRMNNPALSPSVLAIYRKVAGAAEPASYAWGLDGGVSHTAGGIQAFSSVDTANPIDVENGQTTPLALAHATPSVTTTVANTMVVTSHSFPSSATWTPPAGMTESFDVATQAPPTSAGIALEGSRVAQAAAGATGVKTATASNDADDGNAHILALRPVVANAAPTVSLNSPANGATFTAPATITLTATAADSDGTIVQVEFFDGATPVGTVPPPPGSTSYSVTLANVVAGAHTLTVRATDNQGATTTSAPVNITVNAAVAQMYFIQTDHLNTPRLIADSTGTTVWKWDQQEPFGSTPPNDNPSALGVFDFPLRLPGQYYDKETALHYNMMRDYDPSIGRYVESDPIGLDGGLNTYAYVRSSPLFAVDLYGLAAAVPCDAIPPQPDDPCNCQRDVLVDICKCYKDDPFNIIGRGICIERARLKKSKCASDCAPKNVCLGGGPSA